MNDRTEGAIEALAWFSMLLDRAAALNWTIPQVKDEVDLMSEAFQNNIAEDFRLP